MNPSLQQKFEALKSQMRGYESVVVAFSGGIDSSLVAYIVAQELGERALAVTSGSPSLKRSDLALTETLAPKWGMRHRVIITDELQKADYRANPTNRCFHCKTSLYDALRRIADEEGFKHIVNGTNCDDLGDHRPGLVAADNQFVKSPLVDARFCKQEIRDLAEHIGLENAQKPQAACLSSRFPYGSHITEARLRQVESAEGVLADLGFRQYRVRHHEDVARLEIATDELAKALQLRDTITERIKTCGYRFVALDLDGFRSGSLNEGVIKVVNVG